MDKLKTKEVHIVETQEDLEVTLDSFFFNLLEDTDWDKDAA